MSNLILPPGMGRSAAMEKQQLLQLLIYTTRAACDMRAVLARHGTEADLREETREWIRGHDDFDRGNRGPEGIEGAEARVLGIEP